MSKQKRCLWVRRKSGNWELVCSGCGRRVNEIHTSTRQKFITGGEQPGDGAGRCIRAERNKDPGRILLGRVERVAAFRLCIEQWAPNCRIAYEKFHIMQHANDAIR